MAKECSKCHETKALQAFYNRGDKKTLDGKQSHCKMCISKRNRDVYDKEKAAVKNRKFYYENREYLIQASRKKYNTKGKNYRLKTEYGISLDDYNKMYDEQHGLCKICNLPERIKNRTLTVDHCHTTGKIRGLLCFECNTGLGKFRDDEAMLLKALEYLRGSYR